MSQEVRPRVIYEFNRGDFEDELVKRGWGLDLFPDDEEWANIQAGLQLTINSSAEMGISSLIWMHMRNRKADND